MKNHTDKARRRVLRVLAAGGGAATTLHTLPKQWTRPVVDSVILPAHAETSDCFCRLRGMTDPRGSRDEGNPTQICNGDSTDIRACLGCPIEGVEITFTALFNNNPFLETPRTATTDRNGCVSFGSSGTVQAGENNSIVFQFTATCPGDREQTATYYYITNPEGGTCDSI